MWIKRPANPKGECVNILSLFRGSVIRFGCDALFSTGFPFAFLMSSPSRTVAVWVEWRSRCCPLSGRPRGDPIGHVVIGTRVIVTVEREFFFKRPTVMKLAVTGNIR
jgi:hypothetical protein